MEAPDTIFLERILCTDEVFDKWKPQKTTSDDIEYIRADVCIRKALRWMTNQAGVDEALSRQMIEDFKSYMKTD